MRLWVSRIRTAPGGARRGQLNLKRLVSIASYPLAMADVQEQLQEIGTQLAWVRDYL